MLRHPVFIAIAAALASACTADQPRTVAGGPGRQCFTASQVNDFHAIDRDTVLVTIGSNRTYMLDILGTCPEIDWSFRVGIRSTGGSNWICQGQDAELIVPSPSGVQRCPVLGVRPLTPDEARAARAGSN